MRKLKNSLGTHVLDSFEDICYFKLFVTCQLIGPLSDLDPNRLMFLMYENHGEKIFCAAKNENGTRPMSLILLLKNLFHFSSS